VRLKGKDGLEVSLTRSKKIRAIEADITRINDALTRHRITVEHPDVKRDSAGFLIVRGQRIDPTRVAYTRVFNGSLNGGGRLYGPYWQSLPRDVRIGLRIDGEPTAEYDIPACHVQLLRAWAGLPPVPPGVDSYAVDGVPRSVVKKAVLVALNCKSRREAVLALNAELRAAGNGEMAASTIIKRMEAEMPDLPFFTQAALRLQNLDSDVCVKVHLACQAAGFIALSIHDGFVCQRSHRGALIEIINRQFGDACERLRRRAVSRKRGTR
jgi:hypothetical protein